MLHAPSLWMIQLFCFAKQTYCPTLSPTHALTHTHSTENKRQTGWSYSRGFRLDIRQTFTPFEAPLFSLGITQSLALRLYSKWILVSRKKPFSIASKTFDSLTPNQCGDTGHTLFNCKWKPWGEGSEARPSNFCQLGLQLTTIYVVDESVEYFLD